MNKGDLIGNRYQLGRAIGQGGTGRVWLARDKRLDRRVAIKFLLARTAYHRVRFARRVALEAKIAASIQHRNVVQIFDFGTHEDKTPYIVMEALKGFTLGEAFDAARAFSFDATIHIMSEVLLGLAAVHDAGIVHRDVKPENIFLVKETPERFSPKLLDFGISRSLEPDTRPSAVTTTEGMIVGTPQYMSPEQARGDADIDRRTDIYSLGTILFEMFVGLVPFPAKNVSELLIAIIQRDAPSLYELAPQLGQPLCAVVDKALKKDRHQRYADAAEMHDALLSAAQQVPTELDTNAALFPPDAIRARAQPKRPRHADGNPPQQADALDPADDSFDLPSDQPTAATVQEAGIRHRRRRQQSLNAEHHSDPPDASDVADSLSGPVAEAERETHTLNPVRYAVTLGILAALSLGVAAAAILVLRDRTTAPVGTGMIVVQAPSPSPASPVTPPPQAAAEPEGRDETDEPKTDVKPTTPGAADHVEAPKTSGAKRHPTSGPSDPMQLMTAGVAKAFSKQKARVIDCLNKHPEEIKSFPQLTVRVTLDEHGQTTQAELLPDAISSKPVGGCVRAAVTTMSFPKPQEPMTFRVPLTWRRK